MNQSVPQFICLFIVTLGVAMDLAYRRIPNWITVPAVLVALIYHMAAYGLTRGATHGGAGLLVGCMLLIVPFMLGGMGGGDVKLLGALGAWLGWRSIVNVFIYAAWVGALWAVIIMVRNRRLWPWLTNLWLNRTAKHSGKSRNRTAADRQTIPYAAAIGAGYLVFLTYGSLV